MIKLFDSYLDYLSSNPKEFTSLILWFISTTIIYVIMVLIRKKMVEGAAGDNNTMESAEQFIYVLNWTWPAALNYSVFFQAELPTLCWYFMYGGLAWTLGGRWLFEWALALRAGSTTVSEPVLVKTVTEKKVETKEESTQTKTE